MAEIHTPLGAVLSTRRATRTDLVGTPAEKVGGMFLVLRMADPEDPRTAEVFLSWENCTELSNAMNFGRA